MKSWTESEEDSKLTVYITNKSTPPTMTSDSGGKGHITNMKPCVLIIINAMSLNKNDCH